MKKGQIDMWLSLGINIFIPALVLMRFSTDQYLGPVRGLIVALLFPLLYGSFNLIKNKKVDFVAIIGLVGVLLTGGIGLLKLDPKWLAVKEAAIPFTIAITILISEKTKYPIVSNLVNKVIDKEKAESLIPPKFKKEYTRRLKFTTYLVASSFLLSASLNYLLAKLLVKSQPGTETFNAELGRMTVLSYPVIVIPSLIILVIAVIYLMSGIEKYTKVDLEEIIRKK